MHTILFLSFLVHTFCNAHGFKLWGVEVTYINSNISKEESNNTDAIDRIEAPGTPTDPEINELNKQLYSQVVLKLLNETTHESITEKVGQLVSTFITTNLHVVNNTSSNYENQINLITTKLNDLVLNFTEKHQDFIQNAKAEQQNHTDSSNMVFEKLMQDFSQESARMQESYNTFLNKSFESQTNLTKDFESDSNKILETSIQKFENLTATHKKNRVTTDLGELIRNRFKKKDQEPKEVHQNNEITKLPDQVHQEEDLRRNDSLLMLPNDDLDLDLERTAGNDELHSAGTFSILLLMTVLVSIGIIAGLKLYGNKQKRGQDTTSTNCARHPAYFDRVDNCEADKMNAGG